MILFALLLSLPTPSFAKIVPPVVTEASLELDSAGLDDIAFKLELHVENPNKTDLKVEKLSADVKIDGLENKFRISSNKPVTLKAKSSTKYAMPLNLPWKAALFVSGKMVENEKIGYRIEGTARVGGKDIPFEHKGKLPEK